MSILAEFALKNAVETRKDALSSYYWQAVDVGAYGIMPTFAPEEKEEKRREFALLLGLHNGGELAQDNFLDGKPRSVEEIGEWLEHPEAAVRFIGLASYFNLATITLGADSAPERQTSPERAETLSMQIQLP